jgi:DNA mismatch repair ATPase MutS
VFATHFTELCSIFQSALSRSSDDTAATAAAAVLDDKDTREHTMDIAPEARTRDHDHHVQHQAMACYHMQVTMKKGHLIFCHRIVPGVAKASYGLDVAALAGTSTRF